MDNAKELETIQLKGFSDIEATRLYWPMSVIRLRSSDKHRLIDAATYVMDCWNQYSDRTVDINAYSEDGERHHHQQDQRQDEGRGQQDEEDVQDALENSIVEAAQAWR